MTSLAEISAGSTVATALAEASARLAAAAIDAPRLTAELLLAKAIGVDRSGLYARLRDAVAEPAQRQFEALLRRRLQREPLQYLLGHQEFWSLDFLVSPDVLIPRPETERIVELALAAYPAARTHTALRVCDVGTGSGCLAVTLAHEWPAARLTAVDLSAAALRLAAVNAERCGVAGRIRFVHSDLFAALEDGRFDVVVSNPPYVASLDLPTLQPELAHEPVQALVAGDDGLSVIRRLLAALPSRLAPGGRLFMEIGADQNDAVLELARRNGAVVAEVERDYAGLPRVLCGRW